MAFKRALVVDDSRSARVALKKLLDEHDLNVDFAESGEQALEFLDRELVDVVFMDHHMPGMDGLEAVQAIKRNPRTATIPIMMYTTREGEVYLSQARALGAVGVLPKQVQPGVLFDMLLDLGLVRDRRIPADEVPAEPQSRDADEIDRRLDDQALGISLQSIVTRILEDQHLSLRSDILRGNREFARQVATEILEETKSTAAEENAADSLALRYSQRAVTLMVLALLVPVLVLGGLYLQTRDDRDEALLKLSALDQTLEERMQVAESVTSNMLVDINEERGTTLDKYLDGLVWSLNESGSHGFDRLAFDAMRLEQLEELLAHLGNIGFEGIVRLSSHLGEFCLGADRLGNLTPADLTITVEECGTIGHPLDDSNFINERQSLEFAEFMEPRTGSSSGVAIELVAHDRYSSTRRYPLPDSPSTAGEWNDIAARNHRVEFELIPVPE